MATVARVETRALTIVFVAAEEQPRRAEALDLEESVRWMALHEAMVGEVARACGGRKVKQVQETSLFVFDSPTGALRACMAMQDRVALYDRGVPEPWRMPLAIGVCTGEVRLEGGDVFGSPVNTAARLAAKAGAGEILLSESTRLAMGGRVPLEALGTMTLKGLSEPVGVHRVQRGPGIPPYGGEALDDLGLPMLRLEDAAHLAGTGGERLVDRALEAFGRIRARTVEIRLPVPRLGGGPSIRWGRGLAAGLLGLAGGAVLLWWILAPAMPEPAARARALAEAGDLDQAFAALGPDEAVAKSPHLLAALGALRLKDGDPAGAAEAWVKAARRDPGALTDDDVEALRRLWKGPRNRPLVRRRAGEALTLVGEPVDMVAFWIAQLARPECRAKEQAIAALAASGDPRAVPALEQAARESGGLFCRASKKAARALRRLNGGQTP